MNADPASGGNHPTDALPAGAGSPKHHFVLYHAGTTPQASRAIVNTRRICETHLPDRYDLEIVDISKHPERAAEAQIIAAPTLVRMKPLPLRRFIGDMSQVEKIVQDLDLMDSTSEGGMS